ncbi:M24 family metallopeptidase [Thalassobacillus pellis]|uniref:M24 family metallopeptidase n=1 Tax=Thalassobacillus pellis TaxID=748008 RepID=UPI00196032B1|nr:M24 family metallopeptidase [Thalassobacillus pellis]MBM7551465.1 Xaa-Pro aminopeptidase [Thalassobacillus pellis]
MNIEKVRNYLEEKGADGILIRKRNNFSWVTEGRYNHIVQATEQGVADLIITRKDAYLITSEMEKRRLIEEECSQIPFDVIVSALDWFKNTDVLIDEVSSGMVMTTDTPYKDWEVVEEDLGLIRSVLSEQEITSYRDLCQSAASAVEELCRTVKPGQTEYEIEAELAAKVLPQGIKPQVILVATDDRIHRYRHPIPTGKVLDKKAMIVLCAERGGLVANVTRFVHFGELPEETIANKAAVARIDAAMNFATVPGNTAGDVVKAGIAQYEKEGFPEDWKLLHQGGLTGYASREFLADPETPYVIKANQAYAWNPSLPGVKSEDTILVKEDGIEFLTHTDNWVYQEIDMGNKKIERPDILTR